MYPGHWSKVKPNTPALIHAATGEEVSWLELDQRSNQVANLLQSRGLKPGDHVSILMENHLSFFEIAWGAYRSGLYITCINRYLTAEEAAYIIQDSGTQVLFTSSDLGITTELLDLIPNCPHRFIRGANEGNLDGFEDYLAAVAEQDANPLAEQPAGDSMLYSSGTTGQPKGIKRPLSGKHVSEGIPGVEPNNPYGLNADTVYLSPAPLYHAAPFGYCMRALALGGSVVMMERFDPELSLKYIEQYQITHSQWVPTMFIRMLKLNEQTLSKYNLSSHQCAIHAAAPCPAPIKHQMMDWWGPILWEYYSGTERNGFTIISPQEWLANPGSVGKAHLCVVHICDEAGVEQAQGDEGLIYFELPERNFEYHNAPDKTASATHPIHNNWTSLGDVGYLNENDFLFLTDRKAYMIISGGVNIYPREIEDALIMHEAVQDVAVFGVPNADFGEEVKAVVQPMPGIEGNQALAEALIAYAKDNLAGYKIPRSVDFLDELPRLPTGKLYKRLLKDQYWPAK
jgi:long-chain acyl-CoA synthetase|tara:strand:+ start:683 stop:2221 length:1539 start_codon:yes stop_codon:yes gene_type:complete